MDPSSNARRRSSKHYDKIKRLAFKLQEPGNVNDRRQLAVELEQLMSNYDVRVALAEEATPTSHGPNDLSVAATRCLALSTLWTTVFTAAIGFTTGVIKGENGKKGVKPTPGDLGFPDKLLRAATGPDQAFDANSVSIPKLNKKTVRGIVKFCLEMLDNDKVIECGGEIQMLEMLARVCSRPEYLGLVKETRYQTVLSEITCRLTEDVSSDIHLAACKAFDAFFETSSNLGVSVHAFLSDSISIISNYCKTQLLGNGGNAASSAARVHMFNAAASMLFSHPEHSIGPLRRDGRHILRYCKKSYSGASPNHRQAFDRYLLAFIFVSQVAGNIQGRLSGDVGDLGQATFTEKQMTDLLPLIIGSTSKVLETSRDGNTGASKRRIKSQMARGQSLWKSLEYRQKLHLELASKLLACSQRQYLARKGRDDVSDDTLKSFIQTFVSENNGDCPVKAISPQYPRLSKETISQSPWMSTVLAELLRTSKIDSFESLTRNEGINSQGFLHDSLLSVIDQLVDDNSVQSSETPIPFLAIVTACCEVFPSGQCWASSPAASFRRCTLEDGQVVHIHSCSPSDLGLLLYVLSEILEINFRPDGDPLVQWWVLLCLTKLAETTPLTCLEKDDFPSGIHMVVQSWRRIWTYLVREDLRVFADAGVIGENTVSELVCSLLTEMIRWKCTEVTRMQVEGTGDVVYSSFRFKNQQDIWNLVLSLSENTLEIRSPFELIGILIRSVGLSEPTIHEEAILDSPSTYLCLRERLVHFSLGCLESALKGSTPSVEEGVSKSRLVDAIAACLVALSTAGTFFSTYYSSHDARFNVTTFSDHTRFGELQESSDSCEGISISAHLSQDCLSILWGPSGGAIRIPSNLSLEYTCRNKLDNTTQIALAIRRHLQRDERRVLNRVADFLSEKDSNKLHSLVNNFIDTRLSDRLVEGERSSSNNVVHSLDTNPPPCCLSVDSCAAKLQLSLSVARCDFAGGQTPHVIPATLGFLKNALRELTRKECRDGEYFTLSVDLRKLAQACIELNARTESHIDGFDSVEKTCQAILRRYKDDINRIDHCDRRMQRRNRGANDDSMRFSDDEDFDACLSGKREASDSEDSYHQKRNLRLSNDIARKRRKTEFRSLAPPNLLCAEEMGKLLIAINPTSLNVNLVCETLMRTELDLEPDSVHGDIDLRPAELCIHFLGSTHVILNADSRRKCDMEVEVEKQSVVVMLRRVVDLIRASAGPSSNLFMYGSRACGELLVKVHNFEMELTEREEKLMRDILGEESDLYIDRPSLALRRILSTTYAFTSSSDAFRMRFGGAFASIMKRGMSHGSFLVRRFALLAAGVAMKTLDEVRVIKSITDLTAPICRNDKKGQEQSLTLFSSWFMRSVFADSYGQQGTAASDSLEVFESDSIFAKATIANSTEDRGVYLKFLIELLTIPVSRPQLEPLCYRSLERVAWVKNYDSVSEMIETEVEALFVQFFDHVHELKSDDASKPTFSLSWTAPRLMAWLERYEGYDIMTGCLPRPTDDSECESFREFATMRFLSCQRSFLVPFFLIRQGPHMQNLTSREEVLEFLSRCSQFQLLVAMLPSDNGVHINIQKVLKKHIIDAFAFSALLLNSEDPATEQNGRIILQALKTVLSKDAVQTKISKNMPKLIRLILALRGKAERISKTLPTSDNVYYRALLSLVETMGQSNNASGDHFLRVGNSLTELVIEASRELDHSKVLHDQYSRWSQFEILGRFLREQIVGRNPGEYLQLGFFFHTLTEILLKASLKAIHLRVLRLILDLLKASLNIDGQLLKSEASSSVQRLFAVCIHIHEGYQRELIRSCHQQTQNAEVDIRRSCGIKLSVNTDFNMPHDNIINKLQLEKFISIHSSDWMMKTLCLIETYDVIQWITDNKESFGLDPFVSESLYNQDEISEDEMNLLLECNPKYCAQTMTRNLGGVTRERDGLQHSVISLLDRTEKPHAWVDGRPYTQGVAAGSDKAGMNIDQKLLHGELFQIAKLLEDFHEISDSVTSRDLKSLSQGLLFICNAPCPTKLRFAASRCLAMLRPSAVVNAFDTYEEDGPSVSDEVVAFLPRLQAKCIDSLAESLKSSKTEVSSTSMAILKGLLTTSQGMHAYSYVSDSSQYLLKPFVGIPKRPNGSLIDLSDDEVTSLKIKAGSRDTLDSMWCWHANLWRQINDGDTIFEEWICTVTTAIILCCFKDGDKNSYDRNLRDFFWRCQRGTILDHRFASAVFPCLLLAILDIERARDNKGTTQQRNRAITRCFESVLQKNNEKYLRNRNAKDLPRRKAVALLLDTLDLTRKMSQSLFMELKGRPNKRTEELIPWEGVPYGINLHIDGILVASACMEVQRFPSALFYLDLHLNAQFGKSGVLFENISDEMSFQAIIGLYRPRPDISGLPLEDKVQVEMSEDDAKAKYIHAMSMVCACFKELHEDDAVSAIEMQLSSLTLMDDDLEITPLEGSEHAKHFSGIFTNQQQSRWAIQVNPVVVDELQKFGLRRVIEECIQGVTSQHSGLQSICENAHFRETWFESSLNLHSWNKLAPAEGKVRHHDGMFDATEKPTDPKLGVGYFESISKVLVSFFRDDTKSSLTFLRQARLRLVESVVDSGGEHSAIDDLIDAIDKGRALNDLDELTRGQAIPEQFDFADADKLIVASEIRQVSLAARTAQNGGNHTFLFALREHLQKSCNLAINRGLPSAAEDCLRKLKLLSRSAHEDATQASVNAILTRLDEARVIECRGDFIGATMRVKQLVRYLGSLDKTAEDFTLSGVLVDAQLMCGHWMTKYKTQHARAVLEMYLEPAVERARNFFEMNKSDTASKRLTRGSIQLGHVLANLFDSLLARIHSVEWKKAGERLGRQQQELRESVLATPKTSKKESLEISKLKRAHMQLRTETEKLEGERYQILGLIPKYLRSSLENFLLGFKTSGTSSEDLSSHIYRMISLWFAANEDNLIDDGFGTELAKSLCEVSSFRFVPLTNQLFSRLEGDKATRNDFQKALQDLVFKMCNDHPYHCLVPLMALSNGNVNKNGSVHGTTEAFGESKINVAKEIIANLRRNGLPYVAELVGSYEILITAYNDTAYADVTTLVSKKRTRKVKFAELLRKPRSHLLDQCLRKCEYRPCVLTSPPLLSPTREYGAGKEDPGGTETIKGFEPTFNLTDTGIHRPRIVTCLGSNGGTYRQLVKGEDPVRQDAIMSQIFKYVNGLMARGGRASSIDSKAEGKPVGARRSSRKIRIATYNILPLSPMSGVLEWVRDTIPLMDYIEGPNSAHSRYYPNEWNYRTCGKVMKGDSPVSTKGQSKDWLFAEVCRRYSPCFRFFFTERFSHTAESWHAARMKYTRSVAVNSMVGHILGIGDRHLSNILIHTKTGVVVHIDFGIVFEQGKLLAIPELVPFRLTRNIVDGMGPCGTEGTFDSAAKSTMSTLRDNARDLLTILSAVVADPLYSWQTDPVEARRRQTEKNEDAEIAPSEKEIGKAATNETPTAGTNVTSKGEKNHAAMKTIEKIKLKLEGYEDSTFGDQQGVDGQVQLLINSARDPDLLKSMYVGWGPWI